MGSRKLSATAIKSSTTGHMLIHKQIRKCSGFPISIDQCRIDKCKGNTKFLSQLVTTENHMPNHCFFISSFFSNINSFGNPKTFHKSNQAPRQGFCDFVISNETSSAVRNVLGLKPKYTQIITSMVDCCYILQTIRNCC